MKTQSAKEERTIQPLLYSWDDVIKQIKMSEHFNENEKGSIAQSITVLREFLGDRIFEHLSHPIFYYSLINTAPWTRLYLHRLAIMLSELTGSINFEGLIKKLQRGGKEFVEAKSVLDIAYPMKVSGFEISFEEKIKKKGTEKKPDIVLTNPNTAEKIYIEVSQQTQSQEEKETSTTYQDFQGDYLFDKEICAKVKIHKPLSKNRRAELMAKIQNAIIKAKEHHSFETIEIVGILDAGFAVPEKKSELEAWAGQKQIQDTLSGPPVNINEPTRLKGKVRDKMKQLPDDYPSIIVLNTPYMIFTENNRFNIIQELAEQINDSTSMFCLIVYGQTYLDGSPISKKIDELHTFIRRANCIVGYQDFYIIKNRFFELKMSEVSIDMLRNGISLI